MAERKTAEQMNQERRANKAKRRRNSVGKKQANGFSMVDAVKEKRQHQRRVETINRQVKIVCDEINTTGKAIIPADSRVVRELKNRYKGTSVRWQQLGDKIMFARLQESA